MWSQHTLLEPLHELLRQVSVSLATTAINAASPHSLLLPIFLQHEIKLKHYLPSINQRLKEAVRTRVEALQRGFSTPFCSAASSLVPFRTLKLRPTPPDGTSQPLLTLLHYLTRHHCEFGTPF